MCDLGCGSGRRDGPIYGENGPVEAQGGIVQPGAEVCRRRDLNPTGGGDKAHIPHISGEILMQFKSWYYRGMGQEGNG